MAKKVNRDIKYLDRDFSDIRGKLIEYSQTYFPNTYNDFSPTSPGMMFMEQAAYVGDVMSFYLDNQLQETFTQFARQTNNLYELAYMFGYRPKSTGAAQTIIDLYQQVPAKLSGGNYVPDYDYSLTIGENTSITSTSANSLNFLIQDICDFSVSSSLDPTTVTTYQISGESTEFFLLKKSRKAISATINTQTFSFTTPQPFQTIDIEGNNIIKILDITDSNGNVWSEVDYLAQEMIFNSIKNTNPNDTDELITPNPNNVGIGLPFEQDKLTTAYSPTNFLFTNTYGISPSSTTLTVRYLTGGGISSNAEAGSLTEINGSNIFFNNNNLNPTISNFIFSSIACANPEAADGGNTGDTDEIIRQNTISSIAAQQRTVTLDDYMVRAMSMPSDFGTVSKIYMEKPQLDQQTSTVETLCMYILSQNNQSQLSTPTSTLKNNLRTYLSQYRMIGDSIEIKDAYIINIGVNFEIVVLPNFINSQVILSCITLLQNYFNLNEWQLNQPILIQDLYVRLDRIEGVQTVKNIIFKNKAGISKGYSEYSYDIGAATLNSVIYPSLDPSIFEIKYPKTDIKGKVVPL